MSEESRDADVIPPGAKYVASSVSEVFYATEDAAWRRFDPAERRWFQTERAARIAGYRPAIPAPPGLDEFELIERLGQGGTSTVYRARDLTLGREVAIKVMHRSDCADEESLARFAREARLVARLQHPGVVTVYGVKQLPSGGLALIMEYIPGRTLSDLLASGPLPLEQVEEILRDVGEALAAAHAEGIVHRDVKPQNIFLHESTGRARLADFGIAIPLNESNRLTHTGAVIGTPAYMAPEQFVGANPDARSDLYSLGLVGWEMLTGVSPWAGESLYGIILKQREVELPSLRKLRPGLPPRVRLAIEGALKKDPESRWNDVPSFLSHLSGQTARFWWISAAFERIRRRFAGDAPPPPQGITDGAVEVAHEGRAVDRREHGHVAVVALVAGAGEGELDAFAERPCPPDVVGINHYLTSERFLDERLDRYPAPVHGGNGHDCYADVAAVRVLACEPAGIGALLGEAWARYGRPLAVTEVHLGAAVDDQVRWLVEAWEEAHRASRDGADVRAVTVWALLGSFDWASLLTRQDGHYEPGCFDVLDGAPRRTALASVVRSLASGRRPDHPALLAPGARVALLGDPDVAVQKPKVVVRAVHQDRDSRVLERILQDAPHIEGESPVSRQRPVQGGVGGHDREHRLQEHPVGQAVDLPHGVVLTAQHVEVERHRVVRVAGHLAAQSLQRQPMGQVEVVCGVHRLARVAVARCVLSRGVTQEGGAPGLIQCGPRGDPVAEVFEDHTCIVGEPVGGGS